MTLCMPPTTLFATNLILNSIKGTSFQVMKLAKSEKSNIIKCPKNLTIPSIVQNKMDDYKKKKKKTVDFLFFNFKGKSF